MKEKNAEKKSAPEAAKKGFVKPLIISLAAVVALVLVIVLAVVAVSGEGIAKGVSVEGQKLSGMTEQAATEFIEKNINKSVPSGNIAVTLNGAEYKLEFADAIMGYDAAETAKIAYMTGRNGNVFTNTFEKIGVLFGGKDIPLEPALNEDYIGSFIDEMCQTLPNLKVDDYYFMDGDMLKLVFGNDGDYIDVEKFKADVEDMLRGGESGSIVLQSVSAKAKQFDVDEIYEEIATEPSDSYAEEVDGKKYVMSAKNGYEFDKKELEKAIENNRGKSEEFYFELEVIKPENEELDETGLFGETLASYTSKITDSDRNRLTNVNLAATKINGVVINPGDVFAYLSYVEPITAAAGYKSANVYANGKVEKDIGGGVCQVSSALYSAVLYADLDVVKRYNHSLTVGYVPLGQDATVSHGEIDFRFRNNTNEPIKIVASSDSAGVYIKLLGKKLDPSMSVEVVNVTTATLNPELVVEEDPSLQPGEEKVSYAGKTGYIVETYKDYYKDGKFVERKYVSKSHYRKIDKTVLRAPGAEGTPSAQNANPTVPGTAVPVVPNVPADVVTPGAETPAPEAPASGQDQPAAVEPPTEVSPTPPVEAPTEVPAEAPVAPTE